MKSVRYLLFLFILLLTACDIFLESDAIPDPVKEFDWDKAQLEFIHPKPGNDFEICLGHTTIQVQAYAPEWIREFQISINGELYHTKTFPGDGSPFAGADVVWEFEEYYDEQASYNNAQIKVEVIGVPGEVVANRQITVSLFTNFDDGCPPTMLSSANLQDLVPTATPTSPPDPIIKTVDPCEYFLGDQMSIVLFDIQPGPILVQRLYIGWPEKEALALSDAMIPDGWPGVEVPMSEDTEPWEYTATLGNISSIECAFKGYAGRLYCTFYDLPLSMMDSSQVIELRSNKCNDIIYTHGWVSIIGPGAPKKIDQSSPDTCHIGLDKASCESFGGTLLKVNETTTMCWCP